MNIIKPYGTTTITKLSITDSSCIWKKTLNVTVKQCKYENQYFDLEVVPKRLHQLLIFSHLVQEANKMCGFKIIYKTAEKNLNDFCMYYKL